MIQLAQGKPSLLPKGFGVVVVGVAGGSAHRFADGGRFYWFMAHRDGQVVMGEPALSGQGCLATTAGGGDALPPFRIGHVASGVDTGSAGFGAASLGGQVPVAINLQLAPH